MCPFQTVAWQHSGAGGIARATRLFGPWITPLLNFNANTVTRLRRFDETPQGGITGNIQFMFAGQDALRWRQLALRQGEDEAQHQSSNG